MALQQTAVSLVLVERGGNAPGQSLQSNLEHQDFGFDTRGRYLVSINTKLSNYQQDQLVPLFGRIEEQVRAIPGARMVGSSTLCTPAEQP